jgi:hypothetical protein
MSAPFSTSVMGLLETNPSDLGSSKSSNGWHRKQLQDLLTIEKAKDITLCSAAAISS